jgi:hypothetical protein
VAPHSQWRMGMEEEKDFESSNLCGSVTLVIKESIVAN